MHAHHDLSATLLLELGLRAESLLGSTPDTTRWGMLAAPLIFGTVLWAGLRQVPEGARLNTAGQVMLTTLGLASAGVVAGFFSGWDGLQGWLSPETALHSGALLMVLSGVTMLAGGFLRLRRERCWMVQLTAGALLAGAGALGLKGLEVVAFSRNDYALASVVVPMNRVAMGIAGLYLLGALLVALKMPRRLAPISALLALLGLIALVCSWPQVDRSLSLTGHRRMLRDPPQLRASGDYGSARTWPEYDRHPRPVIDAAVE